MAVDGELRNLVAQTLETQGVLGKIRAELRASVFLALDDQGTFESPLENKPLKSFLGTENGMLVIDVVREFLNFFHLDYTKSVFEPETGLSQSTLDRATLARKLNLAKGAASGSEPLLSMLLSSLSSSPSARQSQPAAAAAVMSSVSPGDAADGSAFFSPSSRLALASNVASGRTSPGELDCLRSGGGAAASAPGSAPSPSGTYHARSTAAQPSVLLPLPSTTQAAASSGPSLLASYGLPTPAAVTGGGGFAGVQPIANAPLLRSAGDGHGTAELLEFIGIDKHSRSDAAAGAGAGAALKQSTNVTADRDSKKKRKLAGENPESSISSAYSGFASNHSGSDLSSESINSDSRGQAGVVRDASKKSATGVPSRHTYSDDDDSLSRSGRLHVSSMLSDGQNDTLAGSGSDSSWLSRPAGDPPTNNLDTSDHSISQLSDGDFSYAEDVQT